jgi:hypothetical protein
MVPAMLGHCAGIPLGAHSMSGVTSFAPVSPLAKAKFQFQLCQPFESPFTQDFDTDPNVGEHSGENRTDRRQTKYDRVRHEQQIDQVHV